MSKQIPCKYPSLIFHLHYKLCHILLLLDKMVKEMKNYMSYDIKYG